MDFPPLTIVKSNCRFDSTRNIRIVSFKGCPLSCIWCPQPENQSPAPELSVDPEICVGCGSCEPVCPFDAIWADPLPDRLRCTACFSCTGACPTGSREQSGKEMHISEIIPPLRMGTDSGNVLLSGGEPSLQADGVSRLLSALAEEGFCTGMETCGWFEPEPFMETLLPHLDTIHFDLKLMDSSLHHKYCGRSNEKILENFRRLVRLQHSESFALLPQMPLVPGITDTPENLVAIATFLKANKIPHLTLLPWRPVSTMRYQKLGKTAPVLPRALFEWMPQEATRCARQILASCGIKVHHCVHHSPRS